MAGFTFRVALQRLSSALARAIRAAGGEVLLRRTVSAITVDCSGAVSALVHVTKDGSDPHTVETSRIIGNAAPEVLASLLPDSCGAELRKAYTDREPSTSLFALTLRIVEAAP